MFTLLKNDINLSFSITKEETSFGDDQKTLFWIDLELQTLQRGRQEYIPIDSIDRFAFDATTGAIQVIMGSSTMVLYTNTNEDEEKMESAAAELNSFCGLA